MESICLIKQKKNIKDQAISPGLWVALASYFNFPFLTFSTLFLNVVLSRHLHLSPWLSLHSGGSQLQWWVRREVALWRVLHSRKLMILASQQRVEFCQQLHEWAWKWILIYWNLERTILLADNIIASLWETLSQRTQQNCTQIPDPQKSWDNVCYFNVLWLVTQCITNTGANHPLFQLLLEAWLSLHSGVVWSQIWSVLNSWWIWAHVGTWLRFCLPRNSLGFSDLKIQG